MQRDQKIDCLTAESPTLYRDVVNEVLVDFQNVTIFDPLDFLCDAEYCYASSGVISFTERRIMLMMRGQNIYLIFC